MTTAPPPVFATYSIRSLAVNEVETVRGGAWGYHAGADVSYFFTPKVGVGALVRYSGATVRLENPVSSIRLTGYNWPFIKPERVPIDVGRLDALAGLRLRF